MPTSPPGSGSTVEFLDSRWRCRVARRPPGLESPFPPSRGLNTPFNTPRICRTGNSLEQLQVPEGWIRVSTQGKKRNSTSGSWQETSRLLLVTGQRTDVQSVRASRIESKLRTLGPRKPGDSGHGNPPVSAGHFACQFPPGMRDPCNNLLSENRFKSYKVLKIRSL